VIDISAARARASSLEDAAMIPEEGEKDAITEGKHSIDCLFACPLFVQYHKYYLIIQDSET
jgi:hypothetical protein